MEKFNKKFMVKNKEIQISSAKLTVHVHIEAQSTNHQHLDNKMMPLLKTKKVIATIFVPTNDSMG